MNGAMGPVIGYDWPGDHRTAAKIILWLERIVW